MARKTAKTAQSKRTEHRKPDPRFAALARLLARDLARKHLEQESDRNELSQKDWKKRQAGGYDSVSPSEDES